MGKVRQQARRIMSYLPKYGLLSKPTHHRQFGVSAMMTVKNEEDWLEKSVLSILQNVDEVVVVDNGSDDHTFEILTQLGDRFPDKVRAFQFPQEDFCGAVNFTYSKTRFSSIMRWHGDFVARTTGSYSVSNLVQRIRSLDRSRYYCIWIGPISLDGDLWHQIPQIEVEREPLIFSYSPQLRYRQVGRFEVLRVPFFYKRIDWKELYFFHMRHVKPARRILYRFFWTEWMALPDKSRFPTLEAYVRHRIRDVYGTSDMKEAMRLRILDLAAELVPYDRAQFGDYPAILENDLKRPRYRLTYENGRIVGRWEIEDIPVDVPGTGEESSPETSVGHE